MFDKIKERLGLAPIKSETPIGDALAREMNIDLALDEFDGAMRLHRMQYEQSEDTSHWILSCELCGLWVFDTESELFRHVLVHSQEALNVRA